MSTSPSDHGSVVLAVLLTAPFLAQADATIANVATPEFRAALVPPPRQPNLWSVAT